jgi:hypothetical protein
MHQPQSIADPSPERISRRRVYYLAGFDTRGPSYYHALYRAQAGLQQDVNQTHYLVGDLKRENDDTSGFQVSSVPLRAQTNDAEAQVETEYIFLQWNDVVRRYWPASPWAVLPHVPGFYARYAGFGGFAKTKAVSRAFYWMLLLPLLYLLVGVAIALGLAMGLAKLNTGLAAAGFALGFTGLVWLCERQRVFWLMRAWRFMIAWAKQPHMLSHRWDAFAARIVGDQRARPADEVLIVGHSAGSMAAVSVASRVNALGRTLGVDPRIKIMTIGQAIPLLGVIPEADWFRTELKQVAHSEMPWLDYTAPSDLLCYALTDPAAACGLEPIARNGFRIKSARFDQMFDAQAFAAIKHNYFAVHFQYLMASARPVRNDYFSLTAGPLPLPVLQAPEGN